MRADFHSHSLGSDGAISASEILDTVAGKLDYYALTDHDLVPQLPSGVQVRASGAVLKKSFVTDVAPIFTMGGGSGANCHGSIRGQRGFKL